MTRSIALAAALVLLSSPVLAEQASLQVAEAPDVGKFLTDAQGRTLYLFTKDKKGAMESACTNDCAQAWPPLITTGEPKLGGNIKKEMVGTITRPDGSMQVTFNGHPLYYFAKDTEPGSLMGQDKKGFGGEWYAVSPDGSPNKSEQKAEAPEDRKK